MISYSIIPIRELIDFLEYIDRKGKARRIRNLNKLYVQILQLLVKLQGSNRRFLEDLIKSYKEASTKSLADALSEVKNIAQITSDIIKIEGSPILRQGLTIGSILLVEDKDLFCSFTKITGLKGERIRFWENVTNSVIEATKKCGKVIRIKSTRQNPYIRLCVIPEHVYSYHLRLPIVTEKITIDKAFLEQQIEMSQNIIEEFDKLIGEFRNFVSKNVRIEEFL